MKKVAIFLKKIIINTYRKGGITMLLNKDLAKRVLDTCLATGADFAELYVENKISNRIEVVNGEINRVTTSEINGVGIRILKELKESFGYSNDLDEESVIERGELLDFPDSVLSFFEELPNHSYLAYLYLTTEHLV